MTPAQVAHIMALAKECGAITYTHRSSPHEAAVSFGPIAWAKFVEAALLAPQAEGWVMVPAEIVNRFPEINPSNYDHGDACALNDWGVELVLAATPSAPQQAEGLCDRICGAIKAADDKSTDEASYMLDPSDLTTMFQDAAGTTPVTAVAPDERAEFEAAYRLNFGKRWTVPQCQNMFEREGEGYKALSVNDLWTGWQARASKGTK